MFVYDSLLPALSPLPPDVDIIVQAAAHCADAGLRPQLSWFGLTQVPMILQRECSDNPSFSKVHLIPQNI